MTEQDPNKEVWNTRQFPWEIALEDALAAATPDQVLTILHRIKGWLVGYCETCGTYSPEGWKIRCNCEYKGNWYNK